VSNIREFKTYAHNNYSKKELTSIDNRLQTLLKNQDKEMQRKSREKAKRRNQKQKEKENEKTKTRKRKREPTKIPSGYTKRARLI